MSQTMKLPNYNPNNLVNMTRINSNSAIGASNLIVENTLGFNVGDFIIAGEPGNNLTELLTILTITPNTIITPSSVTKLTHSKFEHIYSLSGNKINIYRAPNANGLKPDNSLFTLLTAVAIQANNPYTAYTDPIGSSAYWYNFTYFNVTTSTETNLSDSLAFRGGNSGDYCTLDSIRREAGFRNSPYIIDDDIDAKRQAAQDEINGKLYGFYDTPFQQPINPRIADICTRLAAGLLLLEQYRTIQNTNSNLDGKTKLEDARKDLTALVLKEEILTDDNGAPLDLPGATGGVSGWPDATTATASRTGGGSPRVFRMADIQGQPMATDDNGNPVGNLYFGRRW